MSMKVLYKGALSYPMDTRGYFAVILPKCSWKKLCQKFSLNNVSPYSATYKSNILISGKMLNEIKYENFHDGSLTLCRNPKSHNCRR